MGDGGQPATVPGLASMPVPPPGVFVPAPGGPQFPGARVQFPGSTVSHATHLRSLVSTGLNVFLDYCWRDAATSV
jgi:hypothetical protein